MARWGRADFRQLQELERKLSRLSRGDFDKFCRKTAQDIGKKLLSDVVKRTPTGVPPAGIGEEIYQCYWAGYSGGILKRSWRVSLAPLSSGGYVVTVENIQDYASYVEYGHRQQPGRYVPALGKSLKEAWVPGKYMLTVPLQRLEQRLPAWLERRLYKFLQEVMS